MIASTSALFDQTLSLSTPPAMSNVKIEFPQQARDEQQLNHVPNFIKFCEHISDSSNSASESETFSYNHNSYKNKRQRICTEQFSRELIDTSSPEALERDFHAWLRGDLRTLTPDFLTSDRFHELKTEFEYGYHQQQQVPLHTRRRWPTAEQLQSPQTMFNESPPFQPVYCCVREVESVFSTSTSFSDGQSPTSSNASNLSGSSIYSPSPPYTFERQVKRSNTSSDCFTFFGNEQTISRRASSSCAAFVQTKPLKNSISCGGGQQQTGSNGAIRSSGTNQLGRMYSPGLPLSMNERQQIVDLYECGWKICDISKKLCVTHSCVSKILNRFRATGSVRPKDAKEGRQESPLVVAIREYRLRLGIVRQSEIREQLIRDGICKRENAPSRSSINQGPGKRSTDSISVSFLLSKDSIEAFCGQN